MISFKLSSVFILINVGLAIAEPPAPNYGHSSYDEMPSHAHSHHHHDEEHGHHPPRETHEVIVQHHHYPPPAHYTRTLTHGSPESSYGTASAAAYKRPRPAYYHGKTASSDVVKGDYHLPHAHTSSDYSVGKLTAGYSNPYRANDYKAYSMITPTSHADDYGSEGYSPSSHTHAPSSHSHASHSHSEYDSSAYDAPALSPSYASKRPNSYSYSPPSHAGSQTSLYGYAPHSAHDHHDHSLPVRSKVKAYRAPSHSSSYSSPASSYQYSSSGFYPPVSRPSTPYSPVVAAVSPKGVYGAPKTAYGKPSSSYGIPTVKSYVPKTTYGLAYTNYEPPAKSSHYRQSSKGYGPVPHSPSYSSYSASNAYGSPSSYGSYSAPSKTYGYADTDKHASHSPKGHVQFNSEDAYAAGENYEDERDGSESYEADTEGDHNTDGGLTPDGYESHERSDKSLIFPITLKSIDITGHSDTPSSHPPVPSSHDLPPPQISANHKIPISLIREVPPPPTYASSTNHVSGSSNFQNQNYGSTTLSPPPHKSNSDSLTFAPLFANPNVHPVQDWMSSTSHSYSTYGVVPPSLLDKLNSQYKYHYGTNPNGIPEPDSKSNEFSAERDNFEMENPLSNENSNDPATTTKRPKKILIKILVGPKSRVAISNGHDGDSTDKKR